MTAPRFRSRMWSQEVAIAEAIGGDPPTDRREPGYEFSHGKRFASPSPNPYVNFPEPAGEGGGRSAPEE